MATTHQHQHQQHGRSKSPYIDREYLAYLMEHVVRRGEFVPIDPRGRHGNLIAYLSERRDQRLRGLVLQEDPLAGVVWVGKAA